MSMRETGLIAGLPCPRRPFDATERCDASPASCRTAPLRQRVRGRLAHAVRAAPEPDVALTQGAAVDRAQEGLTFCVTLTGKQALDLDGLKSRDPPRHGTQHPGRGARGRKLGRRRRFEETPQ